MLFPRGWGETCVLSRPLISPSIPQPDDLVTPPHGRFWCSPNIFCFGLSFYIWLPFKSFERSFVFTSLLFERWSRYMPSCSLLLTLRSPYTPWAVALFFNISSLAMSSSYVELASASQSKEVVIICTLFTGLAFLMVILRLVTRIAVLGKQGPDDWVCVAAMVCF